VRGVLADLLLHEAQRVCIERHRDGTSSFG
jgi:hypothetical protein